MLLTLVICSSLSQADEQRRNHRIVAARVTDTENTPIVGAAVYKLNWFEEPQETPITSVSDSLGVFNFPIDPEATMHSNFVIIHCDGYGFGALNLDVLPARARLLPRRAIALRIVDEENRPVNGALVMAGEIAFSDEFLHARVPRALAEKTGAVTRSDGWASLRCVRPSSLRSLVVKTEDFGEQIFPCDFSDNTKFRILQLHDTAAVEVVLMKGEQPASGWKAVGTFDEHERFRSGNEKMEGLDEPVHPNGINFTKAADAQGRLFLEHTLVGQEIAFLLVDESNRFRQEVKVEAVKDGVLPLTIQVPKTMDECGQEKKGQVVDVQTGEPVAGFHLRFASEIGQQEAVSDETGSLTLKLLPGKWYVHVEKAAPGYCKSITSNVPILVEDLEGEQLQPITVAKSKKLTGKIHDIDLELHRARWIKVHWLDKEGNAGDIYGTVHSDLTFEVSIPIYATAESFTIVSRSEHDGELHVRSQEPLILSGEPK